MNKQDHGFYRGSLVLSPVNHIVMVIMTNGSRHLRRISLNAVQMAQLECRLMQAQVRNDIADYLITAADDCNYADVLAWVESLHFSMDQPSLLNLQQNSLFS